MRKSRVIGLVAFGLPCVLPVTSLLGRDAADGWSIDPSLDLAARAVTADHDLRDDDSTISGDAIALIIAPSVVFENGPVQFELRNSTFRIEYLDDDFADRWRHTSEAELTFATDSSGSLSAFAEYAGNLTTAEAPFTDQWQFGGSVERRFGETHRVRARGAWRDRSYDDAAASKGSGARIDGEYRYRFGANHYFYLRGRYEEIDSANPVREFDRWIVSSAYQRPIARDLRIRPEIAYRDLDYPGRPIAGGGFRHDRSIVPELTLLYSPGDWLFSLEGKYFVRDSTDPEFDRNGYRIALEARHGF
jgi:hypothetical protein